MGFRIHKTIVFLLFCLYIISFSAQDSLASCNITEPSTINFVSSYYQQDGMNSAVTGGIGDEELQSYMNNIIVNVPINSKYSVSLKGTIDAYTSASMDNINDEHDLLLTETSASHSERRTSANLGLKIKSSNYRNYFNINSGFSNEYDVKSFNFGFGYTHFFTTRTLNFTTSFFNDKWDLIYPYELRPFIYELKEDRRQLYYSTLSITQVLNNKFRISLTAESVYMKGLLSIPFNRVYFSDTTHDIERLPNSRYKFPIGIKAAYYISDLIILRLNYRFYTDNFGINAHTINLELPTKASKKIIISPIYRFHTQSSSWYFLPFAKHEFSSMFYTSDYDLSAFNSHNLGLEVRYKPFLSKGNLITFNKAELRLMKYYRINNKNVILKSFIASIALSFSLTEN